MRQTRSARVLLMRATQAVLYPDGFTLGVGLRSHGVHFAEGEPPAGGGAAKKEEAAAPKKLELTEEELQEKIEAAREEERKASLEAKKKEDETKAEEEAKKKGEWETLAKSAEEKQKAAEDRVNDLKIDIAIRDALTDEKLRDYVGCAKYIKPLIESGLAGDEKKLASAVKSAVDQYVKDNPRKTTSGPPSAPPRSGARGQDIPASQKPTNGNRVMAPASRF